VSIIPPFMRPFSLVVSDAGLVVPLRVVRSVVSCWRLHENDSLAKLISPWSSGDAYSSQPSELQCNNDAARFDAAW
jgi:hypothetical protein